MQAIHRMKEETCAGGRSGILVEYMHLDLASLDSVKKFTETLCERNHSLDVLINNAGISWAHYGNNNIVKCHTYSYKLMKDFFTFRIN